MAGWRIFSRHPFLPLIYLSTMLYSCYPLSEMKWGHLGHDRMVVKSPKQSLGDLLFLLRFLLLLFFSFSFSFFPIGFYSNLL
jgi:hypothetical protein